MHFRNISNTYQTVVRMICLSPEIATHCISSHAHCSALHWTNTPIFVPWSVHQSRHKFDGECQLLNDFIDKKMYVWRHFTCVRRFDFLELYRNLASEVLFSLTPTSPPCRFIADCMRVSFPQSFDVVLLVETHLRKGEAASSLISWSLPRRVSTYHLFSFLIIIQFLCGFSIIISWLKPAIAINLYFWSGKKTQQCSHSFHSFFDVINKIHFPLFRSRAPL